MSMDMITALPQDHIKALNQLRMRLTQLLTSINALAEDIGSQNPLPTWPTLQADAFNLGANLKELADTLNSQRALFASMHPYPLPNFPATTHEGLLLGLMRKKLDPVAEDWIDSAQRTDRDGDRGEAENDPLPTEDVQEMWAWARGAIQDILKPLIEDEAMYDDYTLAEREQGVENVVTGITRLDEDDEDEDEDMEDTKPVEQDLDGPAVKGMDPSQPPVSIDNILRFASGYERPTKVAITK